VRATPVARPEEDEHALHVVVGRADRTVAVVRAGDCLIKTTGFDGFFGIPPKLVPWAARPGRAVVLDAVPRCDSGTTT
jgi:hypothetical protein